MAVTINGTTGITTPAGTISGPVVIAQSNGGGVAAISLTQDESTIQGPSANTQIRMGGNLVLNAAGQTGMATNGVDRLVIDSSGRIRMPYQPAFFAQSGSGTQTSTGTITGYGSVAFNVGSAYDNSTSIFTAPVAGKYLFMVGVYPRGSGDLATQVYKNGSAGYNELYLNGSTDGGPGGVLTCMLDMAVGDTARPVLQVNTRGGILKGGNYNFFAGYFLG